MKTKYAINYLFGGIEEWVDYGWGWQYSRTFNIIY